MTLTIRQNIMSAAFQRVKAPHVMTPRFITVHDTANDATACAEIRNINNNNPNLQVSFHFAVDDIEAVQGLPLNRNGWHAGDGNGPGNRQSIGVEVCFSRSGGQRYLNARANGARLVARLMRDHNIPLANVRTHQSWSGKNCPHRNLSMGWQNFINLVQKEFNALTQQVTPPTNQRTHTIVSGDTLFALANRFDVTVAQIQKANNMGSSTVLNISRVLNIPESTAQVNRYFPVPIGNPSGIVAALNLINVDSSFANRLRIANANGIQNYTGSSEQNTRMLNSLRKGLLVRP